MNNNQYNTYYNLNNISTQREQSKDQQQQQYSTSQHPRPFQHPTQYSFNTQKLLKDVKRSFISVSQGRTSPDQLQISQQQNSQQNGFTNQIQNTINQKIISRIFQSYEEDEKKKQQLTQKANKRQNNGHGQIRTQSDNEQILAQKQQEEFNKEFLEKMVFKNKKVQNILIQSAEQVEKLIAEIVNDDGYQRHKDKKQSVNHKQNNPRNQSQELSQIQNNDSQADQFLNLKPQTTSQQSPNRKLDQHVQHKTSIDNQSIFDSFHKTPKSQNQQAFRKSVPITQSFNLAKENFNKINSIIDNLDMTQEELDKQQNDYEIYLQSQEDTKNLVKNHGKRLKNLLDKWCENDEYRTAIEDPKLERYRYDTWGDLIDFEKKLKEEMQKQQIYQERLRYFTIRNIDWVKSKASDYILCLEQALNELKLNNFERIERLSMVIEDHESRAFNVLDDNDFMKSALEVEKEINDTKDITSFRAAMTQVMRLKTVLEKLHKDYVKMVSQSKQMHDDIELFKTANQQLNDQLNEQRTLNDNLLENMLSLTRTTIFYKDDELVKSCRKIIGDCEQPSSPSLKDKQAVNPHISRFLSFMRTYPPLDLVTPLRKECEQYKSLVYCFIDYLQGTGQIIKYWIPQFEDTDDRYKVNIDGWHKNYLITMFEHETLQFLQRFRPSTLQLPYKFSIPLHITERLKQQQIREQKALSNGAEGGASSQQLNDQSALQNPDQAKVIDKNNNQVFMTDRNLEDNVDDLKILDLKSTRGQKSVILNFAPITDPLQQQHLQTSNKQINFNLNLPQLNQQHSQAQFGQKPRQTVVVSKTSMTKILEKVEPNNINNSNSKKKSNNNSSSKRENTQKQLQDGPQSQSTKKKTILHHKTQSSDNIQYSRELKKLADAIQQKEDKQIQVNSNLIQMYQDIVQNTILDKQTIDKLLQKLKALKTEKDKSSRKSPNQNPISLTEQEDKVYIQVQAFYNVNEIFKTITKLNFFLMKNEAQAKELEKYEEQQKQLIKEHFNIPNDNELKILNKIKKLRDIFHTKLEKNNAIGQDYKSLNEEDLRISSGYHMLTDPFYKEGINELSLLKILSIFTKNLNSLSPENFTLATDLVKYKLEDANTLFDDYLRKQVRAMSRSSHHGGAGPLSAKSFLSEGIQAFQSQYGAHDNQKSEKDFLSALRNINQQIHSHIKTPPSGFIGQQDDFNNQFELGKQTPYSVSSSNQIDIVSKAQSAFSASDISQNQGNNMLTPIPPESQRLNSDQQISLPNGEIKKDKRKIEMIRRETIRTIHALQDFVKQQSNNPRSSFKQKQSTIMKLGSINGIAEELKQQENKNRNPRKISKITSPGRRDSLTSLTIGESSENSNETEQALMRYTNDQRSNQSKSFHSKPSIHINKSVTNQSRIMNQSFIDKPNLTPMNKVISTSKQVTIKKNDSSSPKKKVEIKDGKNAHYSGQKTNKSQFGDNIDEGQNEHYDLKDFQSQKEIELFGGLRDQFRELDNGIYMKKMKEFDEEIDKLKRFQRNKRQNFSQSQHFSKQHLNFRNNKSIKNSKIQMNLFDLSHRLTQLENTSQLGLYP